MVFKRTADTQPDFYLASSDSAQFDPPRACFVQVVLKGESSGDYTLVRCDPPLRGRDFGLGRRDLDCFLVKPHFSGQSMAGLTTHAPLPVYVAQLVGSHRGLSVVPEERVKLLAWAEAYASLDAIPRGKGEAEPEC
jgi:hypothetical protein